MSEWISVEDRLPEKGKYAACLNVNRKGAPFVSWQDDFGWVGTSNYRPEVTHWQPLPEPPQ